MPEKKKYFKVNNIKVFIKKEKNFFINNHKFNAFIHIQINYAYLIRKRKEKKKK